MRQMIKYVIEHTTQDWANAFLRDIKTSHHQIESSLFLGLTSDAIKHRLIHQKTIQKLDYVKFKSSYDSKSNRLIFIDTKGISSVKEEIDSIGYEFATFDLTENLLKQLDMLSRYEENKIWVISPDSKAEMETKFSSIERYSTSNTHNTGMSSKVIYVD